MAKRIDVSDLDIYYGSFLAVQGVNVSIEPRSITALIGHRDFGIQLAETLVEIVLHVYATVNSTRCQPVAPSGTVPT